jgi:hypothetical protein
MLYVMIIDGFDSGLCMMEKRKEEKRSKGLLNTVTFSTQRRI